MFSDDSIRNIVVLGDWHMNTRYAEKQLRRMAKAEVTPDAYVHLGDFGIWPEATGYLKSIERILESQGVELWFIDGNHEDFTLLQEYPFDDRGLQKVTDHIFRIPRGYAWKWSNKTMVGLGGAFSVDKRWRTENVDWFKEELITEEDFKNAVKHGSADILFTHEAPWLPQSILDRRSGSLSFTLTEEEELASRRGRDFVARAISSLTPKLAMHGHHHIAYERDFFGTKVIGLDCDNQRLSYNAVEVDLHAL